MAAIKERENKTAKKTENKAASSGKTKAWKIIRTVLIVVVVVAAAIITFMAFPDWPRTKVVPNENATNPYIRDYLDVDISAHRSGAGIAPENTMMAFKKVLEDNEKYGVDTYEFDVNITADGELVILHNLTYDETSDAREFFGRKNVAASELTLAEAKKLNMGENFEIDGEYPYRGLRGDDIPDDLRVVTCDEVIDYIEANSGEKKFNYIIEIKSLGEDGMRAADKLYSIITERNLKDRVIWATSETDVSEYMAKTYPDMPRSANPQEVFQFFMYCKLGKDLDELDVTYVALQIPYGKSAGYNIFNLGTKKMINYAHKYDIAMQYWTINKERYVRKLAENGADCIMTDYPQMAYEALDELKSEQ